MNPTFLAKLTSFTTSVRRSFTLGRIGRKKYFLTSLVCLSLTIFIGTQTESVLFNFFILLGLGVFIQKTVQRLHDINFSGWWIFLMVLPLINILFGIFVLFKKGTSGVNKFNSF